MRKKILIGVCVAIVLAVVGVGSIPPANLTVASCSLSSPTLRSLAFLALRLRSVDPNKVDHWLGIDTTPLEISLQTFSLPRTDVEREEARKVSEWFLSRGGDINRPDSLHGLTPMHDAAMDISKTCDYLQFLLAHGADPNAKAGPGKFESFTPLGLALQIQRKAYENRLKNKNYDPHRYDCTIRLLKDAKAQEHPQRLAAVDDCASATAIVEEVLDLNDRLAANGFTDDAQLKQRQRLDGREAEETDLGYSIYLSHKVEGCTKKTGSPAKVVVRYELTGYVGRSKPEDVSTFSGRSETRRIVYKVANGRISGTDPDSVERFYPVVVAIQDYEDRVKGQYSNAALLAEDRRILKKLQTGGEMPRYTVTLSTQRAVQGQDVTATLRMEMTPGDGRVPNFKNGGLVLVLQTPGSQKEEHLALPNVGAHMKGDMLVRTLPMDGEEAVPKDGILERTFSLREYFPEEMQTPGEYAFSWRIESKSNTIRATPVRFHVIPANGSSR